MKMNNLLRITLFFLSSLCWVSCSNDESLIQPSTDSITTEGEGGQFDITLANGEWNIAGVKNKDGNMLIYGKTLSAEGELIRQNTLLQLDGLGQLEAAWGNKGFRIIRDTPSSLKIIVNENSTGTDFSFAVVLQSGEELKEINVLQKKSQGYRFEKIEYTMKEGDGDSLFVKRDNKTYSFDISQSADFTVFPIFGIKKQTYFESAATDAFIWLEDDSVEVKIPSGFLQDKVYCNEEGYYSDRVEQTPCEFDNIKEIVLIPSGKSKFLVELQYHKRIISYALSLINKRTGENKIIEGKWIEIAPTGRYEIKWVDPD